MNHQPLDTHETETSVRDIDLRHTELATQCCVRERSKALAQAEGIVFSDKHWEVIVFLGKYYLEHGPPINTQTTKALNSQFYHAGGSGYLRRLFSEGPVSQGSHLANLRTPAFSTDASFNTSD